MALSIARRYVNKNKQRREMDKKTAYGLQFVPSPGGVRDSHKFQPGTEYSLSIQGEG